MSDAEIGRFVSHYERLTRHILRDMPGYADLTARLDADRAVLAIACNDIARRERRIPSRPKSI